MIKMKYRAKISFCGSPIGMTKGEVRELSDEAVIRDLLFCGYIEAVKEDKTASAKTAEAAENEKLAETKEPEENASIEKPTKEAADSGEAKKLVNKRGQKK